MEWEYEESVGIAGADRPFDHEGGDDGEDPGAAEGALMGGVECDRMCNTRCSLGVLAEPLLEHDKEEPLKSFHRERFLSAQLQTLEANRRHVKYIPGGIFECSTLEAMKSHAAGKMIVARGKSQVYSL